MMRMCCVVQGQHCGLADPQTVRRLNLDKPAPVVESKYMRKDVTTTTHADGRRLYTYSYATGGGSYLTIDEAMNASPRIAQKVCGQRLRRDISPHYHCSTLCALAF